MSETTCVTVAESHSQIQAREGTSGRSLHLQARYQPGNVYVYLACSGGWQNISGCAVSRVWGLVSPLKGPDTLVMLVLPLQAPGR